MRLTAISYYADFYIGAAIIVILAIDALLHATLPELATVVASALAGFVIWTLIEYIVHRGLYHNVPYFIALHDAHHAEPNAFIGAPPVIGIVFIVLISYVPFVAFDSRIASGLTIGMMAGYMAYMLLHHAAHYWNVAAGSWLFIARRHHALHHFHHLDGNYGITTTLWDQAFGTALETRRTGPVEKPR